MYSSNQNDFQAQPSTATGIPTVPPPNYSYDANNTLSSHFQTTITQGSWSSGLCDCFSDLRNCCITCWCPCITFGQVAEIADKGASSCAANGAIYTLIGLVTACPCFYSCIYRSKMRQQYMLKGSPCGDFLIHCFCEACALCQEYRELKNRGYDMSIGWHGNVERQNQGTSVTPVAPEGGMSR